MQTISEPQARALAFLLHEIRTDWPVESVFTLLGKHRDVPSLGAVIQAATTKALDRTCRTPEPIFQQGAHWPADIREQLPRGPRCQKHKDFYLPCPCCRSEAIGEQPHDPYENLDPDPKWLKETR